MTLRNHRPIIIIIMHRVPTYRIREYYKVATCTRVNTTVNTTVTVMLSDKTQYKMQNVDYYKNNSVVSLARLAISIVLQKLLQLLIINVASYI